jgi:hypothetical protein
MPDAIQVVDLDDAKLALSISSADDDDLLVQCVAAVTAEAAARLGIPSFDIEDVVEFPEIEGPTVTGFKLQRWPVASIASVHLSTEIPRIYDATTELVEDTDFFRTGQKIDLVAAIRIYGIASKAVRVLYRVGYEETANIPQALQSIATEVVMAKYEKRKSKLYHLTNETLGDGRIEGIKWDDWSPHQIAVIESLREDGPMGVA